MRNSEIRDLILDLTKSFNSMNEPPIRSRYSYQNACEYDSDISDKFRRMISNIIKYNDSLSISINNSEINIHTNDLSTLKCNNVNINHPKKDSPLEIQIEKGEGFMINRNYISSFYKDINIFDCLYIEISEKLKNLNKESFNDLYCDIMKESGLIRDENLKLILD